MTRLVLTLLAFVPAACAGGGSAAPVSPVVVVAPPPPPAPAATPAAAPTTHLEVRYAFVNASWVRENLSLAHDEATAWAKDPKNAASLHPPVRHVLVKVDSAASKADADKAKRKAEALLARAKRGEDFAKLAKDSDDPGSKDKGGQYPGEMVANFITAFKDAYDELAPGTLRPTLLRTTFGWHIVKKDPVDDASIVASFRRAKGSEASRSVAEATQAQWKAGKPLEQALELALVATLGEASKDAPGRPKIVTLATSRKVDEAACDRLAALKEGESAIAAHDDVVLVGAGVRVPGDPPRVATAADGSDADDADWCAYRGSLSPTQMRQLIEQVKKAQAEKERSGAP